MVGGDAVDGAVHERCPELLAVGAAAYGRSALPERGPIRDVLRGAMEVVRARFHGHVQALGFCRTQHRQRLCRGQVDDVQLESVLPAELQQHGDGLELGCIRPRGQVRAVAAPVGP